MPNPYVNPVSKILRGISSGIMESPKSLSQFVGMAWNILEPETKYLHNWHVDLICEYLEAVSLGLVRRLIVNLPPRYMKSTLVTIAWPVWEWTQRPWRRFITASYSHSLSIKHSIDRRTIILSDDFKKEFGHAFSLADDQNKTNEFSNDKRGTMVATSVGGSITGKGADTIIVDDLMDPLQAHSDAHRRTALEFFSRTLSTRLNDKKAGSIVVVEQRTNENDLTGTLLKQGGWEHLSLPATAEKDEEIKAPLTGKIHSRKVGDLLWASREGQKELDSQKITMGSAAYTGQYQQRPSPEGGGQIKRFWWRYYTTMPRFTRRIWSWDTAATEKQSSDFSVGILIAECLEGYFFEDLFRARLEYPELKRKVTMTQNSKPANAVIVEEKSSGQPLVQDLQRNSRIPVIPIKVHTDKVARVNIVSPTIESGRVFLPESASWVHDFIEECAAFPVGAHDDQVDAMAHGIAYFTQGPGRPVSASSGGSGSIRPSWA